MANAVTIRTSAGTTLAQHCIVARSAYSRMIGLLAHKSLPTGEGLLLEPCNQVHTFFMGFAIDVIFLAKDNTVLRTSEMKPWRLSPLIWRARKIVELPAGTLRQHPVNAGERLEINAC